jgi:hypothetical protein
MKKLTECRRSDRNLLDLTLLEEGMGQHGGPAMMQADGVRFDARGHVIAAAGKCSIGIYTRASMPSMKRVLVLLGEMAMCGHPADRTSQRKTRSLLRAYGI